jgi:prepilin-type processing-associated H-X9-DG protein
LLVVIAVIGVLVVLLLPNIRVSREAANRMSCANNLKQLGLALHNYYSAHKHLPPALGGTGRGATDLDGNANRLSGLVALLPFIEQQALWEQISVPGKLNGQAYPAMGPAPWVAEYEPWRTEVPTFRCPTAQGDQTLWGLTNYTFCVGDVAEQIHQPETARGVFAGCRTSRWKDITDGLANTIAMSEIGTPSGRLVSGQFAIGQPAGLLADPSSCRRLIDSERPRQYAAGVQLGTPGRGGRWADGAAGFSLVNTILPPNRPSCAIGGSEAVDGFYSTGSFHQGGGNVLMADGVVVFITDSIEAGDQTHRPLSPAQIAADGTIASPFGLWGALGTASAAEEIEEDY